MSYQVLARKWRPNSFAELVGQAHVKDTLINALNIGRLHHAYLFTGTRGVGKTTIARIFAKSLNCDLGVTAEPCGQCDACKTIEKGMFVDLIEIDAASRTKVEDTREMLDNVQYAPTRGRFKVYLIDEVHMLSRHSFNALLKTLEEPPPHVKFLLATTDPQKLPITILSRCLQFNLRALLRTEIVDHLQFILTQEQIAFDQGSLSLLAKAAQGSLRDALSLTDQAIAQGNGGLRMALVQQMLGSLDQHWSLKLLAHIVNDQPQQALDTVNDIAQFMPDYRNLLDQLLTIFHLTAMTQLVPSVAQMDEQQHAYITRLAAKLSPQDVQLYYQLLLNGKKDLDYAPEPRLGFEMVLLRLLAFRPVATVQRPVGTEAQIVESGSNTLLDAIPPPIELPLTDVGQSAKKNTEFPLATSLAPDLAEDEPPEALNQQQASLLFAAQQQGFKPALAVDLTEIAVEQTVEQVAPLNEDLPASEPLPLFADISFRNEDPDDDYGYYESMDHGSTINPPEATVLPTALSISKRSIVPASTEREQLSDLGHSGQWEDPVAAILANRNLPIADLFGSANEKNEAAPKLASLAPVSLQVPSAPVVEQPNIEVKYVINDPQPAPQPLQSVEPPRSATAEIANDIDAPVILSEPDIYPTLESNMAPASEPLANSGIPRKAAEVDEWSALIEQMQLGGLARIFAAKSIWRREGKTVILTVDQVEQHLDSSSLRDQLTKSLIRVLNQVIELEIEFSAEPLQNPLNIQRRVDANRLTAAKQQIYHDPLVIALQQKFAAKVDDDSIVAL